jgi:DNA-binding response OmpR family regulator
VPDPTHDVLVVDDDPAIRRLITMVLQRKGFRVDTAADGVEAVLKLGVAEYDAIILDLMMPNLDGFTFLETLAENDPDRLRKIIITSAASPAVVRDRLKDIEFELLAKPFDIDELVRRVHDKIQAGSR